jgi:hypothetical protein
MVSPSLRLVPLAENRANFKRSIGNKQAPSS